MVARLLAFHTALRDLGAGAPGLGIGSVRFWRRLRDGFFVRRCKEADTFLVFAKDVKAEEVGGAGLGARAGDDGNDFAIANVAVLLEQAFGDID